MSKEELELKFVNNASLKRSYNDGCIKLLDYNNDLQLYLIYENSENYYVIYNPNKRGSLDLEIELYNINKKNINYATRLMSIKE